VDRARVSSSKIKASTEALAEGGKERGEGEKGEEGEGSTAPLVGFDRLVFFQKRGFLERRRVSLYLRLVNHPWPLKGIFLVHKKLCRVNMSLFSNRLLEYVLNCAGNKAFKVKTSFLDKKKEKKKKIKKERGFLF
jgi:hypothetical protein